MIWKITYSYYLELIFRRKVLRLRKGGDCLDQERNWWDEERNRWDEERNGWDEVGHLLIEELHEVIWLKSKNFTRRNYNFESTYWEKNMEGGRVWAAINFRLEKIIF